MADEPTNPAPEPPGNPPPDSAPEPTPDPGPGPVPYDRFKHINDRAKAAEAELEKLKKAQAKATEDALKEQEKWKELYEQAQPQVEEAKKYRDALDELLTAQIDAVPEDKRGLVPDGDPVTRLQWLQKAQAAGLFTPPPQSPGNPPPGRRSQPNTFDLNNMSPEEIRKARAEGKITLAG